MPNAQQLSFRCILRFTSISIPLYDVKKTLFLFRRFCPLLNFFNLNLFIMKNIKYIPIFLLFIALLFAVCFACTNDKNGVDDNMVSIKIQCDFTGAIDPNIVSFALPGIVRAYFVEYLPFPNYLGIPEAWSPHEWTIHLVMAKGTDRTKLAPIITLAPGATITPESGAVLDFTNGVEWTLIAPDGSTVTYKIPPVFVIGDPCQMTVGVDNDGNPIIITIYPDDPRYSSCR